MATRREFLGMVASAGITAAAPGWIRPALAADRMASLSSIGDRALHHTGMSVLASSARIAVPSYRFGVVMRSGIAATGDAGNVSMEATAELVGLSLAQMRQIAGACHQDFLERIAASGRTVVPFADIQASKGYGKLLPTPVPFVKKPFADARTCALVSPEGMPLISQHSDAPLSDQSPMALTNWRAINQMCVDLNCVVMIPNLVIDFAQLSGSGHSTYSGSAAVSVAPGLFLVPLFTCVSAHYAKIALAGPGGKIILKERVAIGQAGEFVKTGTYGNRAEVDWWNATAALQADNSGRPTRAYESSSYEYRVQPEAFAAASLDSARAMNAIYAKAAVDHPAKG
jgi:hypothetical protein